jgi:ribosomal-protein-alanine N-acetyltransferase
MLNMIINQRLDGEFPVIDLSDIILRELSEDDLCDYFNYMRKPEMALHLTADNYPESLSCARNDLRYWMGLFKSGRSCYWGIELKSINRLIGTIGFNVISTKHSRGEISYDLDSAFWHQGIMSKVLKAVLNFVDKKLFLVRVQATVAVDNIGSIKVLEKCGFVQEGRMSKFEIIQARHVDYYMYARVK